MVSQLHAVTLLVYAAAAETVLYAIAPRLLASARLFSMAKEIVIPADEVRDLVVFEPPPSYRDRAIPALDLSEIAARWGVQTASYTAKLSRTGNRLYVCMRMRLLFNRPLGAACLTLEPTADGIRVHGRYYSVGFIALFALGAAALLMLPAEVHLAKRVVLMLLIAALGLFLLRLPRPRLQKAMVEAVGDLRAYLAAHSVQPERRARRSRGARRGRKATGDGN